MENENLSFKGLDKKGNCYFKFDILSEDGSKFKLRVPQSVGFEMVLLMRNQLLKFFDNDRNLFLLNSKEKLEFNKLKEALVDNKDLVEKMNLKASLRYNQQFYEEYSDKINEVELKQEEALVESINNQKYLQVKAFKESKLKELK